MKNQDVLNPAIDLSQDIGDLERQRLEYRKYLPLWNSRSLVEEYIHGNMAVVLDLVPRYESNVERTIAVNTNSVEIVQPTRLIFHRSSGDTGVANDWSQQKVLISNVQLVESEQAVIPSTVRLYVVPHPVKQHRSDHIYISPIHRRVEFLQGVPEGKFCVSVCDGGVDLVKGGNPSVIKGSSEVMNGIPENQSNFSDEVISYRGIEFQRHNSSFRIVLNAGSVTVLQSQDRRVEVCDMLFGPVNLE